MLQYIPDAMNFDVVNERLSRSGLPSFKDLEYLRKELKVKTIINFCTKTDTKVEEKNAKDLGFNYIHLPWSAHFYNLFRINYYWKISRTFLLLVQDPKNHPMHVHCFHGRERTGMMVAIYRMVIDQYSFTNALKEMKSYGFKPQLHMTLVLFLWIFSIVHKLVLFRTNKQETPG